MTESPLVTGFGSIVIDALMTADDIHENQKNAVVGQTLQVGGVIPTALIVLSRLGIATEFHSTVGDDLFGSALRTMLGDEKVSSDGLITLSDKTPFAFVVSHPKNGTRTSFYTTGTFSTAPHGIFSRVFDNNPTYLLVDGHNPEATHAMMTQAKEKHVTVILDLGNPKAGLDDLISLADTIIVPKAYWKTKWNDRDPNDIARELLGKGPKLVVITMEEQGCIVAHGDTIFHQPSFGVNAIDTNGAGDVFFGSFTYGLIQKWPLVKVAQFACAAGAKSCTIIGKANKIPRSAKEIFDFIAIHT